MARVTHFEIAADNMKSQEEFYTKVFGWEFIKEQYGEMKYWRMRTGTKDEQGIGGSMVQKNEKTLTSVRNIIRSTNIDHTLKLVKENGGKILQPKKEIGEYAFMAAFEDPEGNVFGVIQVIEKKN